MRLAALATCVLACTGAARPPPALDEPPRETKIVLAPTEVADGGYTREDIDRVMTAHAAELRACYATRAAAQKLGTIAFDIGADGIVSNVVIGGGGELATCLEARLRTLRFPPKGWARIVYPAVPGSP